MERDIDKVLFSEEQIKKKLDELGKILTEDYRDKNPIVVGVLKGAFIFTADIVRHMECPLQNDFIVASSYGNMTETTGSVKIIKDLDSNIEGRHVILIEDIIDSGFTMYRLMDLLKLRRPASIKLCALFSKPSRREVDVKIDYCGWEIPDEFIVGYGLDYAQKYRNLPYVGILKREVYA